MKSSTTLAALVAHCRKLARCQHTPDAHLLRRFVEQREAAAFEELVERYAPLVWSVCRRILPSEADCEDAFQAAFLCLVRQASSIDLNRPLGAWLHTIAVRTAAKARGRLRRQPTQAIIPEQTTCGDIADELGNRELFRVVDEEIARLPALLCEPFVLCCLEGRTRDEAAAALGCSVAAVKSRLERSRNLLRRRLERRGIGLPAAFLVLGLTGGHVQASLRAKAVQCVFGSAPSAVAALVPAAGVSLASKLTLTAMSLVMVGVLGFGALHVMLAESPQEAPAPAKDIAPQLPVAEKHSPRVDRFGDPLPSGAIRRFGTLRLRHASVYGLAFTPDGKAATLSLSTDSRTLISEGTDGRVTHWDLRTGNAEVRPVVKPADKREEVGRRTSTPESKWRDWSLLGRRWRLAYESQSQDRLNILWRTLAETPDKAYSAAWELLDHPAESVPFLIGKLAPDKPIAEKRVRQLLSRLDSESFAEREEANRQLLALGEQTLPLLRQALKDGTSLEARKRIEGVLSSLSRLPSPDQLRLLRALAALEWSNRPEADEHLQRLAGGAPSASLTRAAKSAWQRSKHGSDLR